MAQPAYEYHNTTSYERSQLGGYFLDWENQPGLVKTYAKRNSSAQGGSTKIFVRGNRRQQGEIDFK